MVNLNLSRVTVQLTLSLNVHSELAVLTVPRGSFVHESTTLLVCERDVLILRD